MVVGTEADDMRGTVVPHWDRQCFDVTVFGPGWRWTTEESLSFGQVCFHPACRWEDQGRRRADWRAESQSHRGKDRDQNTPSVLHKPQLLHESQHNTRNTRLKTGATLVFVSHAKMIECIWSWVDFQFVLTSGLKIDQVIYFHGDTGKCLLLCCWLWVDIRAAQQPILICGCAPWAELLFLKKTLIEQICYTGRRNPIDVSLSTCAWIIQMKTRPKSSVCFGPLTCIVSVILWRASCASGFRLSRDSALLYNPSAVTSFSCSSSLDTHIYNKLMSKRVQEERSKYNW